MGNWIDTTQTLRPASSFEIVENAAWHNLPTDGTTDAGPAIRAAAAAVHAVGGGEVYVPWCVNGLALKSLSNPSDVNSGCLLLYPNVRYRGNWTKLKLGITAHFFRAVPTIASYASSPYITANTLVSDQTLTVSSSAALAVGQQVLIEMGQSLYDAFEPDWWLFAVVTAIPDATHVTIDRPVCFAMSVAGVPSTNQRSIRPITVPLERWEIDGFELYNDMAGSANASAGISCYATRNFTVKNIVGVNPGSGVVGGQYCEQGVIQNIDVPISTKQGGVSFKGRGMGWAECRNISHQDIHLQNCEGSFLFMEARCENVTFDNFMLDNAFAGRDQSQSLILNIGNTNLRLDNVIVKGKSCGFYGTGGDPYSVIRVGHASFYMDADPFLSRLHYFDSIVIRGYPYDEVRTYSKTFAITPNDPTGASGVFVLPKGLCRRLRIHTTSTTGLTSVLLHNGTSHGANFASSLVAGQQVLMSDIGIGTGYFFNLFEPKEVRIATDATMPAAQTMTIYMEYFPPQAVTDDGSTGRIQG